MAGRAYTYNVIRDFNKDNTDTDEGFISYSPYWIVAIIRLGSPLSFNRSTMSSITTDVSSGALLRAEKPLIITDDILHIGRSTTKANHTQMLTAQIKQTDINYLVEIIPGDWVFQWAFNNKADFDRVLQKLNNQEACNDFNDGFKFLGRVNDVRKTLTVGPGGIKTSMYTLQCVGFDELNTQFFYDNSLASHDTIEHDLGQWLARLGVQYQKLFANVTGLNSDTATDALSGNDIGTSSDIRQNNINSIIPTLIDLIVGQGPQKEANIQVAPGVTATPTINSAPYAYVIPKLVGKLLGKEGSKGGDVIGYSDILELLQGVQQYTAKIDDTSSFSPELRESNLSNRRVCTKDLLGTFIPYMPDFCNRPLWSVLQQYLNATINDMYTVLRTNIEGDIVPTLVVRQIPFTTDAFNDSDVNVTRFLDVPRWQIPAVMVEAIDIGRSNATRTNFVHIYGASSYLAQNVPIQYQIVNNPPIRDDLDIMRSGLKSYMATVECFTGDQVGLTPKKWMELVADWSIGSHLTLNGSIKCRGIQAPICHGDNLVFDGVVYHIESINDSMGIGIDGIKFWTTTLHLSNGMRDTGGVMVGSTEDDLTNNDQLLPIYPAINKDDNTTYDPGLTLDGNRTTGGDSQRTPSTENLENQVFGKEINRTDSGLNSDFLTTNKTDF